MPLPCGRVRPSTPSRAGTSRTCALHPLRHRPLISPPTCRAAAPACQDYYVVAAVRDPAKMHAAAEKAGVASTDYAAVELQLASLQSVKDLSKDLKAALGQRGLDRLVCNAVRLPTAAPDIRKSLRQIVHSRSASRRSSSIETNRGHGG